MGSLIAKITAININPDKVDRNEYLVITIINAISANPIVADNESMAKVAPMRQATPFPPWKELNTEKICPSITPNNRIEKSYGHTGKSKYTWLRWGIRITK